MNWILRPPARHLTFNATWWWILHLNLYLVCISAANKPTYRYHVHTYVFHHISYIHVKLCPCNSSNHFKPMVVVWSQFGGRLRCKHSLHSTARANQSTGWRWKYPRQSQWFAVKAAHHKVGSIKEGPEDLKVIGLPTKMVLRKQQLIYGSFWQEQRPKFPAPVVRFTAKDLEESTTTSS